MGCRYISSMAAEARCRGSKLGEIAHLRFYWMQHGACKKVADQITYWYSEKENIHGKMHARTEKFELFLQKSWRFPTLPWFSARPTVWLPRGPYLRSSGTSARTGFWISVRGPANLCVVKREGGYPGHRLEAQTTPYVLLRITMWIHYYVLLRHYYSLLQSNNR